MCSSRGSFFELQELINKVKMKRMLEEWNQIPRIHGSMVKNSPWAIITNIDYLMLDILLRILCILSHLILHKM